MPPITVNWSDLEHFHVQTWLEHMQIRVGSPPPWGKVEAPSEPTEIVRATPSGEAPGEILRRQARELLDTIPAAELPSALVFLEFLRDRGATSLLGLTPSAPAAAARRAAAMNDAELDDKSEPALG